MSSAFLEASTAFWAFAVVNTLLALISVYLLLWKRSSFGFVVSAIIWALSAVVYGLGLAVSANLTLVDSFVAACVTLTFLGALGEFVRALGLLFRRS